jgi:outer membrane translocation and assembly module TamA
VLEGQASAELTREAPGSPPLPFYLLPRIGGSATLRGFALDRFYGRNTILLSIEYQYRIHPNFQVSLFHDAGKIFDKTAELGFFDWHRNYGIGFRYRTQTGTKLLIELGPGDEGFAFHISFGDHAPRALGGPIRYPLYRQ